MKERRVERALKQNHIPYDIILHSQAYTSLQTAQAAHVKGKEFAKTIMVNVDGKMLMVVLPASYRIDLKRIKEAYGAKDVSIAHEEEFAYLFSDSSIGAMPPMGNLYGIDVAMDEEMKEDVFIAFNACNHEELIQMKFRDYKRMVHPRFLNLHKMPA